MREMFPDRTKNVVICDMCKMWLINFSHDNHSSTDCNISILLCTTGLHQDTVLIG